MITKWQTIINRAKSDPEKIRWTFQYLADALRMGFLEPGELTVLKLNTVFCDVGHMKRVVLSCVIDDRLPALAMPVDDIRELCGVTANHSIVRQELCKYPDATNQDLSMSYMFITEVDGSTGRRKKSFELAMQFLSQSVYGKDYDGHFKTAVKNAKTVNDLVNYDTIEGHE